MFIHAKHGGHARFRVELRIEHLSPTVIQCVGGKIIFVKQDKMLLADILETRQTHPQSQRESGHWRVVVRKIEAMFEAFARLHGRLAPLKVLGNRPATVINVGLQIRLESRAQAKTRYVLVVPHHGEIVRKVERIGAGTDGEVVRIVAHINGIAVTRANQGEIGGEPVGENMVPTHCGTGVSITKAKHFLKRETVVAIIERDVKPVVFSQNLRHLGIHVIEVDFRFVQVLAEEGQQKSGVGPSPRQHDRCFVVKQRHFQHQTTGYQTDTTPHSELLGHVVLHRHVQNRGKPAAKIGRNVALVERGILHHIVVEHREEAQEM